MWDEVFTCMEMTDDALLIGLPPNSRISPGVHKWWHDRMFVSRSFEIHRRTMSWQQALLHDHSSRSIWVNRITWFLSWIPKVCGGGLQMQANSIQIQNGLSFGFPEIELWRGRQTIGDLFFNFCLSRWHTYLLSGGSTESRCGKLFLWWGCNNQQVWNEWCRQMSEFFCHWGSHANVSWKK